jgi:uncharacterized protein (TIGR02996 family)
MPMEHPDWPAFLAAIIADPDDDTARLAAADFLEENGDPDRAAFIRIQVELARLAAAGEGKSLDADHLRAKERAFLGPLSVNAKLWAAEACPELVQVSVRGGSGIDVAISGSDRLTWERGFVHSVTCPAVLWARHGTTIRKRQPIRSVILTGCDQIGRGQWYAFFPTLRGLKIVSLQGAEHSTGKWVQEWLVGGEIVLVL